jgi:DNA-binding MarR family transcriptional regulator
MKTKKLKRIVIKEELVAIAGNFILAAMLNQFIYWSERTADTDKYIAEEEARVKNEGGECTAVELTHGWVYKSADELSQEMMLDYSPSTMRRYLKELVQLGFLDERTNPNHKWDRTLQYRPNLVKIQQELTQKGFPLDGYALPETTSPPFSKMKNGVFILENQSAQNEKAIPEITKDNNNNKDFTG